MSFLDGGTQQFLFRLANISTWLIGDEFGVDSGRAFLSIPATSLDAIINSQWSYWSSDPSDNASGSWIAAQTDLVLCDPAEGDNIYASLRRRRTIPASSSPTLLLRNSLQIPSVGLGTGGLDPDRAHELLASSVSMGYRLFDSAREYRNEHILGDLLRDNLVSRAELFLETKVWPTELGFVPTSRAVEASLTDFGSSYVDLYLLHWPR